MAFIRGQAHPVVHSSCTPWEPRGAGKNQEGPGRPNRSRKDKEGTKIGKEGTGAPRLYTCLHALREGQEEPAEIRRGQEEQRVARKHQEGARRGKEGTGAPRGTPVPVHSAGARRGWERPGVARKSQEELGRTREETSEVRRGQADHAVHLFPCTSWKPGSAGTDKKEPGRANRS